MMASGGFIVIISRQLTFPCSGEGATLWSTKVQKDEWITM